MSGDSTTIRNVEKDEMLFRGYEGRISFDMFDKHMARYMRMKYGTTIGNALWKDDMPELEGNGRLTNPQFKIHCQEILDSISLHNASRAKLLGADGNEFWTREWQKKWRTEQWERLHDVITMKCRGQAALCMDELDITEGNSTRKHLLKHFGGASEDVKFRERRFEQGMPKHAGAQPFPKGIDIEAKMRQLRQESMALRKMCPAENRDTYEYGKEKTLVKIIMKHIQVTEYKHPLKELMLEMKLERMVNRRANAGANQAVVDDDADVDDWEYRNYKDDWVPSFERLRLKLMSYYKEKKFQSGGSSETRPEGKSIPSYLIDKYVDDKINALFAPGYGQQPTNTKFNKNNKLTCWSCGKEGHKRGDSVCNNRSDDVHKNAPIRAKRRASYMNGMKLRPKNQICKFYQDTGKCRFGAKCKFAHSDSANVQHKRPKFSDKQKSGVKALKTNIHHAIDNEGSSKIDEMVKGFCYVRTIPREFIGQQEIEISALSTVLVDDRAFVFDTGSAEGISTNPKDFVFLDDSVSACNSVCIKGPSVGAPECKGRGPLIYTFDINGICMGLIHPHGILAGTGLGQTEFRLASAGVLKRKGIRHIGGKFDEIDIIECVRSKTTFPAPLIDGILVCGTTGYANNIVPSPEFKALICDINSGVCSPLVNLTPFLKGNYVIDGECNRICAKMDITHPVRSFITSATPRECVPALLMNEAKLTSTEQTRLWCRRFGYCDTKIFPIMSAKPEFGNFPKLQPLNEDNICADLAKFKRKPFKRNNPDSTMNSPPWWRVFCDGYGGQESLGGESHEGAKGAYIFCCASTGSTDIRLYASHEQFPVCLHQFLVRVQAEFWTCRVIYVDTHSVNLSRDVEEVLALFQVQLMPVSAGSPQEMAFAESRVRVVKRMSTAMLTGAPHLNNKMWALADKYAIFVSDFLPQTTRENLCPFFMRTGRKVDWKLIAIKVFGAPCVYAPMDGPIHKRAPIAEEGYFLGYQWPAALIQRKSDGKILNVSRQKIRVHESVYTAPLRHKVATPRIEQEFNSTNEHSSSQVYDIPAVDTTQVVLEPSACELVERPRMDKNMVQSIKFLRDHQLPLPGRQHRTANAIEESARFGNVDPGGEGLYYDKVVQTPVDQLAQLVEEHKSQGHTMKDALMKAIRETTNEIRQGELSKGKHRNTRDGISKRNIIDDGRRCVKDPEALDMEVDLEEISENSEIQPQADQFFDSPIPTNKGPKVKKSNNKANHRPKRKGKGKKVAMVGDLVSVAAEIFDSEPGSYSNEYPDRVFGTVKAISGKGIATVTWLEDKSENHVKLRDLHVEKRKWNPDEVIAMLEVGDKAIHESKEMKQLPKNFFEALVRSDWRKWVEAVKKEIAGWEDNNAVEVVLLSEVPGSAKIVPLGELFSIKRSGTYKFRQYLMGNLLRPGLDYTDSFSTTISSTGTTVFFALATTSGQIIYGWDAICGYLQTKEQFDIFAFLPSHEGYSSMEYEEIAEFRKSLLKILKEQGMTGIKKFASAHKKQCRANPEKVYKCNASIYGDPSAGSEFEKLMNSVHIQTAGMTQTQPEPSMYVKLKVDENDKVCGYLVVIAFVDDVRMFGTEPEVKQYMKDVQSRLKVTFDKPPIEEFISIQTFQNLEEGTCELKMPKYFEKASLFFKEFIKGDIKERKIPISVQDEAIMATAPTEDEIKEAKDLPYLRAVGILSYPASNCKFELRYAVSLVGSRRTGWSKKQFLIVVKIFEYAYTTREIGIIYSKGLDPHGDNVMYAFADANLRIPRPQGCRIVMMNGAAISFVSKKQTLTAPSTCWAECVTQFDCSTDILGLRNLMAELGMYQEYPTVIFQDNKSAIQIANNRGSLGKSSRAMDLKTLSIRNRVEDHQVRTEFVETSNMCADMGTKALPENPFVRFRDVMNGYALVKAKFPNKAMSSHVYEAPNDHNRGSQTRLKQIQSMIMRMQFANVDDIQNDSSPTTGVQNMEYNDASEWEEEEVDANLEGEWIFKFQLTDNLQHCECDEMDGLPDPRLYDIDAIRLLQCVKDYTDDPTPKNPFDSFYEYVKTVEPDEFKKINKRRKDMMKESPIPLGFRHLPPSLGDNVRDKRMTITRMMFRYAADQERTISEETKLDVIDNFTWPEYQHHPTPTAIWMRWQRWRMYFLHRVTGFYLQKFSFDNIPDFIPYGPPMWRPVDSRRATRFNWIYLSATNGRFEKVEAGYAYQDEFPDLDFLQGVKDDNIMAWVKCTFWNLNATTPSSKIWWNRQAKVNDHLKNSRHVRRTKERCEPPEWGRVNQHHAHSDNWDDKKPGLESNNYKRKHDWNDTMTQNTKNTWEYTDDHKYDEITKNKRLKGVGIKSSGDDLATQDARNNSQAHLQLRSRAQSLIWSIRSCSDERDDRLSSATTGQSTESSEERKKSKREMATKSKK